MSHPALILGQAFAIVYGLVIGSFLAVCILRLPEDRSLLVPSACPRCGARVRWFDNVPVVSWLVLRGRCRSCGTAISPFYPMVELLTGLLAWLAFRSLVHGVADLDAMHAAAWVVRFGFLCLLVVTTFVDVRHRIIPDQTSIYAVPFGIAGAACLDLLGFPGAITWQQALFGAAFWGGAAAVFSWMVWFVTRVDALGWGDVKLIAMLGSFLGILPGTFVVLFWGSLLGSAVGIAVVLAVRRRVWLPFGPPLALAAAMYVLFAADPYAEWWSEVTRALQWGS